MLPLVRGAEATGLPPAAGPESELFFPVKVVGFLGPFPSGPAVHLARPPHQHCPPAPGPRLQESVPTWQGVLHPSSFLQGRYSLRARQGKVWALGAALGCRCGQVPHGVAEAWGCRSEAQQPQPLEGGGRARLCRGDDVGTWLETPRRRGGELSLKGWTPSLRPLPCPSTV